MQENSKRLRNMIQKLENESLSNLKTKNIRHNFEEYKKYKTLFKRVVMSVTIEDLRKEGKKTEYPQFRSGQTVRVHYKVTDGEKERIQIFEGLVIAVNGKVTNAQTIIVRRVSSDGYSVEQGFAIHSPIIQKIELVKIGKVRQSRIYYMRERTGKAARLKERFYTPSEVEKMVTENNA